MNALKKCILNYRKVNILNKNLLHKFTHGKQYSRKQMLERDVSTDIKKKRGGSSINVMKQK